LDIHSSEYDNLLWLFFSEAPRLSNLKIFDYNIPNPRDVEDFIHRVFQAEKHRIKISPTRLDLGIRLDVPMTLRVLERWSQVQDLTLYWDEEIGWDGTMLRVLCNTDRTDNGLEKALCPDLQVLRIVMWHSWPQKLIDDWLIAVRQILKARKNILPLWKITTTSRHGLPVSHSMTIFDVD
jgi:hypothetical protein